MLEKPITYVELYRLEVIKNAAANGRLINVMCFSVLLIMAFLSPTYLSYTLLPIVALGFAWTGDFFNEVIPRVGVYASIFSIVSTIVAFIAVVRIVLGV